MGRRYFCEYCNKTFIDELEARRKHLSSTFHIKLRNLHYEQHRDPRIILLEESQKTPCRRFLHHGECQFAGNCKYSHYSREELWSLKQQVEWDDYERKCKAQDIPDIPSVESWIEQYNFKHNKTESDDFIVHWSYPEYLECRIDLPPSMKKFGLDDFKTGDFSEWGL